MVTVVEVEVPVKLVVVENVDVVDVPVVVVEVVDVVAVAA